jgi:hypothetical protein
MIDDTSLDSLDRYFLDVSSKWADPLCWVYETFRYRLIEPLSPNKFSNFDSKIKEIATRAMIVLGGLGAFCLAGTYLLASAVVLGIGSKFFRSVGFALQKNGFTHVFGKAKEKEIEDEQASVMTWSLCGKYAGLSLEQGVIHWRSRVDMIADKILEEDPEIIVLQEVYDTALCEAIIEKLNDHYAHFFIQTGPSLFGNVTGTMVISKCAVNRFSHTEFEESDYRQSLGFEMIEIKANPNDTTPCIRIYATQLSSGKENEAIRENQLFQIINTLAKEETTVPTLFVGNTNIDRDSDSEGEMLSKYFYHSYRGNEPTLTGQLAYQWSTSVLRPNSNSDYISLFKRSIPDGRTLPVIEKNIRMIDCHLVKAFDPSYNTKTALSEHHGIVTRFSGIKSER